MNQIIRIMPGRAISNPVISRNPLRTPRTRTLVSMNDNLFLTMKCISGVRKMNQCNSFIYSLKSLNHNTSLEHKRWSRHQCRMNCINCETLLEQENLNLNWVSHIKIIAQVSKIEILDFCSHLGNIVCTQYWLKD